MKAVPAIYKGDRILELSEKLDLPQNTVVLVVISDQEDETELRLQMKSFADIVFAKMWDNDEDEVWNEYV
jgi:hypothetical protein